MRHAGKPSKRPLTMQAHRMRIPPAPFWVQCMPDCFSRAPTEDTQHYTDREPFRGGHDYLRASAPGGFLFGGRARLSLGQTGTVAPNSQRRKAIRAAGMDRCGPVGAASSLRMPSWAVCTRPGRGSGWTR